MIIIVTDGLRAGSVTADSAPTLYAIRTGGVGFDNSHSLFPTFTTANASAIATGHYLGDTGDFSNSIYIGRPVFSTGNFGKKPDTPTPFVENDQVLGDINDTNNGNYLTEETFLALARANGYSTAAVGKLGPTLIQDVTQGAIDHGTNDFKTPDTIIIDDTTGHPGGIPLSRSVSDALTKAGLGTVTPSRGANGNPGTVSTAGTLTANVAQQKYFTDAITQVVLPRFESAGKPFAMVYWSRDPDGTQHNQGDSLNTPTPGINGPTSAGAIRNVDDNIAQILAYLKAHHLDQTTDVFVTADHGFSTVSHYEVNAGLTGTHSFSAGFRYVDPTGAPEVRTDYAPPGFLAIDIAHELDMPLYDASVQVQRDGQAYYKRVDPTISHPLDDINQHPATGSGLIGGSGKVARNLDAQVVVATNGGSDLIYLPAGNDIYRQTLAMRIVSFLTQQDYVSGIFTNDALGDIPGALPMSAINLIGVAATPQPAIVVNFASFTTTSDDPEQNSVEFADTNLQEGQGIHGSFSRGDTFNFMAAIGPDFKQSYVDHAPVSNADVTVTLADILNLQRKSVGKLRGRVITESLLHGKDAKISAVNRVALVSKPLNGKVTVLDMQIYAGTRYFDTAGFPGQTVGLADLDPTGHFAQVGPLDHCFTFNLMKPVK